MILPRTALVRGRRLTLIALFVVLAAVASGQTFTEFPVLTRGGLPVGITSGPDGALWFTEQGGNKIGRITTAGLITEFTVPTANSNPVGIATGSDGNLWFTELTGDQIGRITTAGVITEFAVPSTGSLPSLIAAGPDGNLWFTEFTGNNIGKITTAGVVTEFPIPTPSSGAELITAGPDGALWFTEQNGNKIGRITTAGVITEFSSPTAGSRPFGIITGPDGALWFTELNGNQIGRITTAGAITEFPIPTSNSDPVGIATGSDGNLWFTEQNGNKIGRITTAGVVTEFPIPTAGSQPQIITSGPDGALWFAEFSGNQIGRITTGAVPTFLGPTPYLCKGDSPFIADINAGKVYLEDFECGVLTVPGVTPSTGSVIPPGFIGLIDSVDCDDGSIDGSGLNGHSFFSGSGSAGITFTFNATTLGSFPTEAGIAWTDGGGTTTFEAFDAVGASLGMIGPVSIADGSNSGTTAEDRFFGVINSGGISAIKISNTSGGIEVDHLQYGLYTISGTDLSISKLDSPDPVATGGALTYTITVSNAGPAAACLVTVTDALPAGVSFVSASGTGWNCSQSSGVVTCTSNSVAQGAAPAITIQVTAPNSPTTITNTATVSTNSFDPLSNNNSASATTTVGGGCPVITLSPPTLPGGTQGAAYSQTITASGGASPYTFAVTSGALPAGLTLSSGGVLSGTPTGSGTFNFTVTATDVNNCTGSQAYSLVIAPSGGCQAPPAPVLSVSPVVAQLGQMVTLSWNGTIASGQGNYRIQVSINSGGFFDIGTKAASGFGTITFKYTVANTPGTYNFRVLAVPACNPQLFSTSNSAGVTVTGPCSNAPVVTGVAVSPTSALAGAAFTLTWNPAPNVTGSYGVFRSTDGGQTFTQIATTSATSFTGTVAGQPGTVLTFEVEVLGCVYSQKSNFATLTILSATCDPPNAVTNIQIAAVGPTPVRPPSPTESFLVSWTPAATGTLPTHYGVRINGDPEILVPHTIPVGGTATSLQGIIFGPRGTTDPITAFVTPYGCSTSSSAELYDPAAGSWSITGNLGLPRQEHTATALADGRVLVAGGLLDQQPPVVGGTTSIGSAEIYSAATASWASTGSLATPRNLHAATLLANSQVLVEGGLSVTVGIQTLSSSELYDLVTGAWSAAGSLATPRAGHTATLLSTGKVLVVGGSALSSCELYDPSTKSWTAAGSLATARSGHTATLLTNGNVLVTGGRGPADVLSSAELYDPVSGTWTSTGSLGAARENHTATLLGSGKVLVAGGNEGGSLAGLSSAELYDPATGTWSATGSLLAARTLHTATLLSSGKVLMSGGFALGAIPCCGAPDTFFSLRSAELYDPATGAFSATGSLNGGHGLATATLLSTGKVLLAGGTDSRGLKAGPTASSGVVALFLTPPVASFTVSANPRVGVAVTFTDTSSPQATSWLWIFDDGATDVNQSPTHTFASAGMHTVSLVATNSAGSSTATQTFTVAPATAASARAVPASLIRVDSGEPGRRRARVEIGGPDRVFLRIRTTEAAEAIVFLRFLDASGRVASERRLSIRSVADSVYDLGAYGIRGVFSIELVSDQRFEAVLSVVGRPGVREVVR
jgi:uncharacterized repeat protein (TIGR01451 family)